MGANAVRGLLALCTAAVSAGAPAGEKPGTQPMWTVYVTNDNCPDYTWGHTEKRTRKAFADIVRGHLDEMKRTDGWAADDRDRYNMAVTQEALCFVEHYPQRKAELIRRIKEGRVFVSPYLCNTLWGFQSFEGAVRSFYPARRLERDWGIRLDVAEHIEEPCLPWGVATILAGCGIRWLSVPFYGYDSTFGGLRNAPLFAFEGPDGSRVRVVMDRWACGKSSYTQGAHLLRKPDSHVAEWLAHYTRLGKGYPLRAILASGTHGDIAPHSGGQARGFAEAIRKYNASPGRKARLVNAALPQFCRAVDAAESKTPFLPTVCGGFGHSWDVWPVCLAKYVAALREGERRMLAAEALLVAADADGRLGKATQADRQRAEWCWAMLADHAWNGTGEANKRHNAELRRQWGAELNRIAGDLQRRVWLAATRPARVSHLAVFNPLSIPRRGLVRVEAPPPVTGAAAGGRELPCQAVTEGGKRVLYFLTPKLPGFGLAEVDLKPADEPRAAGAAFRATPTTLEGPHYRLTVDVKTGGLASLVHKPGGTELVAPGSRRSLCQTVYFDGAEHTLRDVTTEVAAVGAVLARLRIRGRAAGIDVTNLVTIYADLDRVDFDLRIHKPTSTKRQRLCQVFPVLRKGAVLRIETPAAVIRPRRRPAGDLLPGADTRRFAVQGFVDAASAEGAGVTIAPLDAFLLRTDLEPITFEALGNDQNYREVVRDQNGVKTFRFRYALRAHGAGWPSAEVVAWSRSAATGLLAVPGMALGRADGGRGVAVDPARAVATCLKPADDGAAGEAILRLWETAGRSGPIRVGLRGFRRAVRADLLERGQDKLTVTDGAVTLELKARGLAAVRLLP